MRTMPFDSRWTVVCAATLMLTSTVATANEPASAAPGFNREIRPILSDKCFFCHGPDSAKRKSGLRLDERDAALKDGAIVPGEPEKSEVWKRITATDGDDLMPPADAHKTLKPSEIEVLRRWIAAGAVYEPHWSYVPVVRPAVPGKGASAIDAFVKQRLQHAGLAGSIAADRRTLLRRLSLDITGLPPTPAQMRAFENDTSQNATEVQIDRLLASPSYGERMAVPWLDIVRFADTVGYHGDQNQHVFPYRDYVINAFNSNKRFDEFTIEQVAGDLLAKPTTEQLVASGFNRLNMMTREGGAQPGEYLAKYMADRVRAIGAAWLGSTVGCAQCHDHKYDPILAKDFYSLGAFFADIREWGVYADYPFTPNPDLPGLGNEDPFPPTIDVPSPFLKQRAKVVDGRSRALLAKITQAALARSDRSFSDWIATTKAFVERHHDGWEPLVATLLPTRPNSKIKASTEANGVVLVRTIEKLGPFDNAGVDLSIKGYTGTLASLRLDLVPQAEHNGSHLRDGASRGSTQIKVKLLRDGKEIRLPPHSGQANVSDSTWRNGQLQRDIKEEWRTPRGYSHDRLIAVWELAEPQPIQPGDEINIWVNTKTIGAFALFASPFASMASQHAPSPFGRTLLGPQPTATPNAVAAYLRKTLASPTAGVKDIFALSGGATGLQDVPLDDLHATHRQWLSIKDGLAPMQITVAQTPRTTRLLPRGNWQDETGPVVTPAVLHFLPQLPSAASKDGRRPTRLDLARWLTSPQNPLTARAFVNRLWKQFFGTGLSAVLDDLGGQGEPPSHPELLDWLAAEFMQSGWNVKHMVKLITMSRTYQQESTARPDLMAVDPQNRLLGRQSQRRLDAEFVRDNALFVAGLLNPARGGPSVFPYQPEGYYENIEFPQRGYVPNTDEQQYRRGVYTHWQRTFLHPMLANFDAPSREECIADRPQSNTPQQALTLLNDPSFVEAARALAFKLLQGAGPTATNPDAVLSQGFELATGRTPDDKERRLLLGLLAEQSKHYETHQVEASAVLGTNPPPLPKGVNVVQAAAWTSVCRVLLNMYETVTRI